LCNLGGVGTHPISVQIIGVNFKFSDKLVTLIETGHFQGCCLPFEVEKSESEGDPIVLEMKRPFM